MRAVSYSASYLIAAMIGMGGGPFLVGVLSDHFTPQHGVDGLRYALLVLLTVTQLPTALFQYLASRTLNTDAELARS